MRKHVLLKLSKQSLENLRLELSTPGEGKTGIHVNIRDPTITRTVG